MSKTVVIGRGLLTPLGHDPGEILDRMLQGETGIKDIAGFGTGGLACTRGGELQDFRPVDYLGKKGLPQLDRTGRLTASAAVLALADAGLDEDFRARHEVGLVLGTHFCSAGTIAGFDQRGLEHGPGYVSPLDFANTVINAAAGQAAIRHNLRGVNSTLTGGACAGLKALAYAHDLILARQEDIVLAGGAEELAQVSFTAFDKSPYLGEHGFCLAEGAAFAVLAPEHTGLPGPRYGKIIGHCTAWLAGGDHGAALAAINELLEENRLQAGDIGLICASAAGYKPVDTLEQALIERLFPAQTALFTPKHWLGEGLGTSGPWQLLLTLEALKRGEYPRPGGNPGSLAGAPRRALIMGLSTDGLFDALLVEGCAAGG